MELRRRGFLKGMGALGSVAMTGVPMDVLAQAVKAAAAKGAATGPEIRRVKSGCAIRPKGASGMYNTA
jgi:anaerobic selenocysteine-containing dehydrogenase